jgi:hypothetical protein
MSEREQPHMFEGLDVRTAQPTQPAQEERDITMGGEKTPPPEKEDPTKTIADEAKSYTETDQAKRIASEFGGEDIQIVGQAEKNGNLKKSPTPPVKKSPVVEATIAPTTKTQDVPTVEPSAIGDGPTPLETYEGDAANAIKRENVSKATIAIAEEKKRQAERGNDVAEHEAKRHSLVTVVIYIMISVLCVGGGLSAIGFYVYKNVTTPQTVATRSTLNLIPVDFIQTLDTTNLSSDTLIKKSIDLRQSSDKPINSVVELSLKEQQTSGTSVTTPIDVFLRTLDPNIPSTLLRSFTSYVTGWHEREGNEAFLLIKTDYYENAYAGMLRWEPTMARTLGSLMRDLDQKPETIDINTRLQSTNGLFVDTVFENKDVRELRSNNQIVLMYSFIDPQTLLIAGNEFAFKEILDRYVTSKLAR